MILRRFRRQPAGHSWFAMVIDLLILVVGVFLGLQVNTWNEDRIERATAHQNRLRLIADVDANQVDWADRRAYIGQVTHRRRRYQAASPGPVHGTYADIPDAACRG